MEVDEIMDAVSMGMYMSDDIFGVAEGCHMPISEGEGILIKRKVQRIIDNTNNNRVNQT